MCSNTFYPSEISDLSTNSHLTSHGVGLSQLFTRSQCTADIPVIHNLPKQHIFEFYSMCDIPLAGMSQQNEVSRFQQERAVERGDLRNVGFRVDVPIAAST